MAWLIILMLGDRLAPGRALSIAAGAMGLVLAGRILFGGLSLEAAEIAGMAAALLLARPLARLPHSNRAWLLAVALLFLIAYQGLAPFDFQVAQDRFAFLPFGESLTQYRAANLADMFLRCFTNGALVWLLAQTGLSDARGHESRRRLRVRDRGPANLAAGPDGRNHGPAACGLRGGLAAVFEREDAG